jgi:hypothetical protein
MNSQHDVVAVRGCDVRSGEGLGARSLTSSVVAGAAADSSSEGGEGTDGDSSSHTDHPCTRQHILMASLDARELSHRPDTATPRSDTSSPIITDSSSLCTNIEENDSTSKEEQRPHDR